MIKPRHKVLAVPDLHAPMMHRDAADFLAALNKRERPDQIVLLGDELDACALSDYDHDPDGMSAGDELRAGIRQLQPICQLFPRAKVCTSNHGARIYRRALRHGIPRAYLREYREFSQAPVGWDWADYWTIDDVVYFHGEGVSGPEGMIKAASANQKSTVGGHLHTHAGVRWLSNRAALLFGFNVGWLGDASAYSMAYGKHLLTRGILGAGIVDRGAPHYYPMPLDSRSRWTGKLPA